MAKYCVIMGIICFSMKTFVRKAILLYNGFEELQGLKQAFSGTFGLGALGLKILLNK